MARCKKWKVSVFKAVRGLEGRRLTVEEVTEALRDAKKEVTKSKEAVIYALTKDLQSLPPRLHQKLLDRVYWLHPDMAGVTRVVASRNRIKNYQPALANFALTCKDCGQEWLRPCRSWGDYNFCNTTRSVNRCPKCSEKSEESKKEADARRSAEEALAREQAEQLRTMPYEEYLQTTHWKNLSYEAKRRAGWKCQTCNKNKELETHHRTYERRGCEWLSDLTVLCRTCHQKFHNVPPRA